MRSHIQSILLASFAACAMSCASSSKSTTDESASAHAHSTAVAGAPCVMQSAGKSILHLTIPDPGNAKCTVKDGFLYITSHYHNIEIWYVPDAHTIDQGVSHIATQITSEFTDFKATKASSLTVAGEPATRVTGTGEEADDGDPGTADVIVFQVANRIFIACTHGEDLDPKAQELLGALVMTAKAP
ncbi:MAG TPA: hypothetical protein VG711_07835 [Phycisphaerales bacterium]|nr:hypothetical protein [Phycisphaerales bacterium]